MVYFGLQIIIKAILDFLHENLSSLWYKVISSLFHFFHLKQMSTKSFSINVWINWNKLGLSCLFHYQKFLKKMQKSSANRILCNLINNINLNWLPLCPLRSLWIPEERSACGVVVNNDRIFVVREGTHCCWFRIFLSRQWHCESHIVDIC